MERVKTLLVVLLCLGGAGVSGYLVYLQMNSRGEEGSGTLMAVVQQTEARVQRKAAATFLWNPAETSEALYLKDAIQTGPASAASVKFNDGSVLELGENSLVVIDEIRKLTTEFKRGTLVVHGANGDERVSVGADGKAKTENLLIRLLKPSPYARYFIAPQSDADALSGSRPVRFSWKLAQDAQLDPKEDLKLQISQNREFRALATQEDLGRNFDEKEIRLKSGHYYWRIVGKAGPLTATDQFRVSQALPLRPVSPAEQTQISHFGDEVSVGFSWVNPKTDVSSPEISHVIEVASDPDFRKIIGTEKISADAGRTMIHSLPDGKLYWRIRSRYGDQSVVSPAENFSLVRSEKLAIQLGSPEDAAVLGVPKVRFSWDCSELDLDYRVSLETLAGGASGAGGKSVVLATTPAMSYLWSVPPPGAYRWKVEALRQGQVVGDSEWRGFSITQGAPLVLKRPLRQQSIFYWDSPAELKLAWAADPFAADNGYRYEIDLSRQKDFKQKESVARKAATSREGEVTLESKEIDQGKTLADGNYFWRVRVVNAAGQTLKTSEIWAFKYGVYPRLSAPALSGPAPGAVVELAKNPKDALLSWSKVEGATGYEVSISSDAPQVRAPAATAVEGLPGTIVFQSSTPDLSLALNNLPKGNFHWSVRAIDRLSRRGDAAFQRTFQFVPAPPLKAPRSISAEVQ